MTEKKTVSKSAFAKEVGLAPSRITQLIADGLPVRKDGRIDLPKGKAWMETNLDRYRREARKPTVTAPKTASAARIEKLFHDSRTARLRADQLEGKMIDREAAERVIFVRARFERDSLLALAARSAPKLAVELGTDPIVTFNAIDRMLREHLTDMAATPWDGLA
jgi:hypothetical protein